MKQFIRTTTQLSLRLLVFAGLLASMIAGITTGVAGATSSDTVVAWGFGDYGQTTVPAGLTDVIAVAGGRFHSLALRSDGTVVGWGCGLLQTNYGQCAGLTGAIAIAANGYHSLALKSDGTVVAWGNNTEGQTNVPFGLTGVTAIAAGLWHNLALKNDGTVVAWGSNSDGQRTVPAGLTGVTAIAAGASHSLALKSDGTVIAWGGNMYGQGTVPSGLTDVTAIAAGGFHNLALKSDGTVVAWGANFSGQSTTPAGLTGVIAIAAGSSHSLALKSDGTVVAWGDNGYGQSTVLAGLSNVTAIGAAEFHSLALVQTSPEPCPAGQYNNGSGCVAAAPGYYVSVSGATEQTPCAVGFYQPNAGALSCIPADAGHYVDVTAALMQIDCLPGSYQPNSGATSCTLASPHYYVPVSAAIEQIQCPVGTTSEAGATACTQIPDTNSPTIILSTPANGATYLLNQVVLANYACQDEAGGSGLASCAGTVASGSAIDTFSVAAKSFTVNAADQAGNPASASASYNIVYNFSGFSSPVDSAPTMNVAKAGQAIPLKWRVTDANGAPVTNLSNVMLTVVSLSCSLGTTTDAIEEYASGNSGLQNLGNGYYQFNWSTPKTYANSCKTLKLNLGEGLGVEHTALFKFTK